MITGGAERRRNLPTCLLELLYCGCLTPFLLDMFLLDLTCSLLSFSKNSLPPSVNGTVGLMLFVEFVETILDGGFSEEEGGKGRREREDTQPSLGFGPPAFGWTQHISVYAGCQGGEISPYPLGFLWLI